MKSSSALHGLIASLLLAAAPARAQFDPARVVHEPPAVAARFADPDVAYPTPAFRAGRADFPSHAEVLDYLDDLARASPRIRVETIGHSQRGLPIVLAVLSAHGVDAALPTVLVIAQQHGNEPAGGEAALALAQQLAGPRQDLLDSVNVLIVPRANPDGAERFVRASAGGIDVNRDHLLLRTPEARAIAAVALAHPPQLVLDLHEFTAAGRWVDKFGAMQRYDALVQAATVANLDPVLAAAAQRDVVERLRNVWSAQGLNSFDYHTAAPAPQDLTVSMGGVQADTGRNVYGLRPAISVLVEVRGVGLGRTHLLRRVHTQVLGAIAALEAAAEQGPTLVEALRAAAARTRALACTGRLVVAAGMTPQRRELVFVDAVSGADKAVEVDWRAAQPLVVQRQRPRPCGYLLAASEVEALARLRLLGVQTQPVRARGRWTLERYAVQAQDTGHREDARGAVDDGDDGAIRVLQVATRRERAWVEPGAVYVPLDQDRAGLVAAALEPDSQNSYAANRLLAIGHGELRRVMVHPPPALLGRE